MSHRVDSNSEFFLLPGCLESSESESSKTEDETSSASATASTSEKIGEKTSAAKEPDKTPKIQDGGDQDRGVKKSRHSSKSASKKSSTPFGETDKRDADDFYVDIIYAVLHMIGKAKISWH